MPVMKQSDKIVKVFVRVIIAQVCQTNYDPWKV